MSRRSGVLESFDANHNGDLNRVEFCEMCLTTLRDVPHRELEIAVANLRNAKAGAAKRNDARWNEFADTSDSHARVLIPALYFLCLILIFNLDLRDGYETAGTQTDAKTLAACVPRDRVRKWAEHCARARAVRGRRR